MKDKRQGKLDKHFPILCDGHKVRIMKWQRTNDIVLEIVTLIRNDYLVCDEIVITEQELQHIFIVKWRSTYRGVNIFYYSYEIISERHEPVQSMT